MAQNYLQYSVETAQLTAAECHFIENVIASLADESQWEQPEVNDPPDNISVSTPLTEAAKIAASITADAQNTTVEYMLKLGHSDDDHIIWFYADEYGCPYFVGALMSEVFKKYRPTGQDIFTFEWSESCSKTALNQFAGGAVVSSRLGIYIKHTSDMLNELTRKALRELKA